MAKRPTITATQAQTDVVGAGTLIPAAEVNQAIEMGAGIGKFLVGLRGFFKGAEELEAKAQDTLRVANQTMTPETAQQDEAIQIAIRQASEQSKAIDKYWEPRGLFHRINAALIARQKRATDALDRAKTILNGKHNTYTEQAKRAAWEAQAKIDREAQQRAEALRAKELADLEAAALEAERTMPQLSAREEVFVACVLKGYAPYQCAREALFKNPADSAQRLMETPKIQRAIAARQQSSALRQQATAASQAPLQVQQTPEVVADVVKAAGAKEVTRWHAEITDEAALIAAWKAGQLGIPDDLFTVNMPKANELARSLKANLSRWPGIIGVPETKVQ